MYGYLTPHSLPGFYTGALAFSATLGIDLAGGTIAAGDIVFVWPVPYKLEVRRFLWFLTEASAGATTKMQLKLHYNTSISTSGATLIATMASTDIDDYAAGSVLFVDIATENSAKIVLEPGNFILLEADAISSGTGLTGAGFPMVEVDYYPEVDENITVMKDIT